MMIEKMTFLTRVWFEFDLKILLLQIIMCIGLAWLPLEAGTSICHSTKNKYFKMDFPLSPLNRHHSSHLIQRWRCLQDQPSMYCGPTDNLAVEKVSDFFSWVFSHNWQPGRKRIVSSFFRYENRLERDTEIFVVKLNAGIPGTF